MRKIASLMVLVVSGLFAIDDSIGVREYKTYCRECHGTASKGAAMRTSTEWEALFSNDTKQLISLHIGSKKATDKLKDDKFHNDSKRVLEFLKNNASDTGNVRGCSGASCG